MAHLFQLYEACFRLCSFLSWLSPSIHTFLLISAIKSSFIIILSFCQGFVNYILIQQHLVVWTINEGCTLYKPHILLMKYFGQTVLRLKHLIIIKRLVMGLVHFHSLQEILLCISHTCTQQDCSPLWNEKVTSFGHFPIVIGECLSYVFQDKAFQQKLCFCKGPLSFHSFTGDFSTPCTCGFW